MPSPHVSFIIPAYNREAFLERSVVSCLAQTVQNIEVIVVDDGSTDDTVGLVRDLATKDPRVRLLVQGVNFGAQAARNAGIRAAKANIVAFHDSDDECFPSRIAFALDAMANTGADVVHAQCLVRYGDDTPQPFGVPPIEGRIYADLLQRPGPVFPALTVRKAALESIGYLDETIPAYQEWDTSIRLAREHAFAFVAEPAFIYQRHGAVAISNDHVRDIDGYATVVRGHLPEIILHCGGTALAWHFSLLAERCYRVGQFARAARFYLEAMGHVRGLGGQFRYLGRAIFSCLGINPLLVSRHLGSIR